MKSQNISSILCTALSPFSMLCPRHLCLIPECRRHPKRKPAPLTQSLPSPDNLSMLSLPVDFRSVNPSHPNLSNFSRAGPVDNGSSELVLLPLRTLTTIPEPHFVPLLGPPRPGTSRGGPHVQRQAADPGLLDYCVNSVAPWPLSGARGPASSSPVSAFTSAPGLITPFRAANRIGGVRGRTRD